jgi:cell division protein FtsB
MNEEAQYQIDQLTARIEQLEAAIRELQDSAHTHMSQGWASGVEYRNIIAR